VTIIRLVKIGLKKKDLNLSYKYQPTGVSTFASPTNPSTGQSLQKSFHLSHPDKIELKKFPFPSENKKYATTQTNTTNKKTVKLNRGNGLQRRKTEHQQPTFIGVPEIPSGISGVLRVDCNPAPRQFI
jgi:hypothetical protein